MISFKNDYSEGAHPKLMEVLIKTNLDQHVGYGEDEYTKEASDRLRDLLEAPEAYVRLLVGGTQTNLLVISHLLRPYEGVISTSIGHINTHEAGAIEATGHKVLEVVGKDNKVNVEVIQKALDLHSDHHMVKPRMVYLSNPNELGGLYKKEELRSIYELCKKNNLFFYIDGARFASALASPYNDIELNEYKNLCDVFYLGGTKCGALFGEAVVFFNKEHSKDFEYAVKQKGALLAKGRLLGLQFNELFKDNLYYEVGKHSNDMALMLKEIFIKNNIELYLDSYSNQQFIIVEKELANEICEKYGTLIFEEVSEGKVAVRFVTSWATRKEDVETFGKEIEVILKKYRG